mmetsp:Transcript_16216/g.44617  ORF Transcript_16216/g.44617 Transcript_16216/m.44617 type:complete len:171 (+) Transcript_16216:905-1417(+)
MGKYQAKILLQLYFCRGELYFDLVRLQEKGDQDGNHCLSENCAFVLIEELAPFPTPQLSQVLGRYKNLREIAWVQEEPKYQGALDFVMKQFRQPELIRFASRLSTFSRPEAATPAQGTPQGHHASQTQLMSDVLGLVNECLQLAHGLKLEIQLRIQILSLQPRSELLVNK